MGLCRGKRYCSMMKQIQVEILWVGCSNFMTCISKESGACRSSTVHIRIRGIHRRWLRVVMVSGICGQKTCTGGVLEQHTRWYLRHSLYICSMKVRKWCWWCRHIFSGVQVSEVLGRVAALGVMGHVPTLFVCGWCWTLAGTFTSSPMLQSVDVEPSSPSLFILSLLCLEHLFADDNLNMLERIGWCG